MGRMLLAVGMVCVLASSAFPVNLIIEGPRERGEGELTQGGSAVRMDVYSEDLLGVGIVEVDLVFTDVSGAPSTTFHVSTENGNPDYGGLAVFPNTVVLPSILPIFGGPTVGFTSMSGEINLPARVRLLSIVYDYSSAAPGSYSISINTITTYLSGWDGNPKPLSCVAGGLTVVQRLEWFVDDDAPGDPGPGNPDVSDPRANGSAEHPFDSIQKAIDAVSSGCTITVRNGTYRGTGNRDIDFGGKSIRLRSEGGPANCTIDCQGTSAEPRRAFYFHSGESAGSIVEGFTITGGYASASSPTYADSGGGILAQGASPSIINNLFRGNTARQYGGGVYCTDSAATITGNTFDGNVTTYGSGAGVGCGPNTSVTIAGNVFTGNAAYNMGGGIG